MFCSRTQSSITSQRQFDHKLYAEPKITFNFEGFFILRIKGMESKSLHISSIVCPTGEMHVLLHVEVTWLHEIRLPLIFVLRKCFAPTSVCFGVI